MPALETQPGDPLMDSPERAELRRMIRQLIEEISPAEHTSVLDESETFDAQLYSKLAELGLLGIDAPEEFGGGGDVRDQLVLIEELAKGPTSMAAFMISQFAVVQVLASFGRTAQAREVLAALVAGRTRVSFALSEPDGGTDVARVMKTRARRVDSGGFVLHGQKTWISGAAEADWLVVLARSSEIERSPVEGITMFLVPTNLPGIEIRAIDTLGIHSLSTCDVFLDDVEVPEETILGDLDRGMRQVFATVNREGLNAAAATLGVGLGALELAIEHTKERFVFGKPVASFQVPQHWMVDAAVQLEAARSLMGRAAEIEVAGGNADSLASMAKLIASEAAVEISLKGMQLMGGAGYTRASAMQRLFRDGRLWSFSPLNNEMVRNRLGEGWLGLPRSY
ncbi:MAG: acyl-CoA/acyl-ACP dehydrogenase [bacterium]|nr:acyl-CoA dehydrogenase [Deltaproteobacteria bacterium]MCP4908813.1 acyl-CoA/acyl-ACP dehydrogenase [bacterium]